MLKDWKKIFRANIWKKFINLSTFLLSILFIYQFFEKRIIYILGFNFIKPHVDEILKFLNNILYFKDKGLTRSRLIKMYF